MSNQQVGQPPGLVTMASAAVTGALGTQFGTTVTLPPRNCSMQARVWNSSFACQVETGCKSLDSQTGHERASREISSQVSYLPGHRLVPDLGGCLPNMARGSGVQPGDL